MNQTRLKNLSPILVAALIITVIIIVVIAVGLNLNSQTEVIQGQVEANDYRVSSKVPGRVLEIRVEEGQSVSAGDTLAVLEAPDIEAKLAQATAAREAAQAMARKADNGAQHEQIEAAYQLWQKAKVAVDVTEKSYTRINNLFEQGVMPEQKRDEAYAAYQAAIADERAAKSQYDMAEKGARAEDKSAAEAQVQRADAAITEVKTYMNETILTAAHNGVVTEIYPEVGELVGTGAPIMNVSRIGEYWFVFNVREDYLPGMKANTELNIYVPAFDKTVKSKITRINDVGTYAVWKATKALDEYDLKTFEVKAVPVNFEELDGIRPGMSAIIRE